MAGRLAPKALHVVPLAPPASSVSCSARRGSPGPWGEWGNKAFLLHCSDDFASKNQNAGRELFDGLSSLSRGRIVLNNLSEQIRECLQHAEDCARKAADLPVGSTFRQDFLNLEQRWLDLARSIEFGEQLDSFTKSIPKRRQSRSSLI
jgi:hypothetical protein